MSIRKYVKIRAVFTAANAALACAHVALAVPPATPYTPGQTLAPACAPGSANCTVQPSAASGANADITSLTGLTTALSPTQGGAGLAAYAVGDLLYGNGVNTLAALPIGAAGQVLKVAGGLPVWAADVGEVNTASNVGAGGVGIYKQKTGVNLDLKNLNAGSNRVSITNDAVNDEVDIDLNLGNIGLASLGGTLNLATQVICPVSWRNAASAWRLVGYSRFSPINSNQ